MDHPTMLVLVVVVFALVAIFAFVVYKRRAKVRIKGPPGTELSVDASNESSTPAPGVKIEDARSHSGGVKAQDRTGRGADIRKVEAAGDIEVSSETPQGSGPKV
ncbi:MAG: hypothetical protein LAO04_04530 [Acidobacteriia bacterium]|nr:hypothetical protein [Terriglobia bacterium]